MSGIEFHKESASADRLAAPLGNSETFDYGDPVGLLDEQLSDTSSAANAELTILEIIGFALEPAEGIHAASRTGATNGFGATENADRTYVPFDAAGLYLRTRNYWADGASGTDVAKNGALIGTLHGMIASSAGVYGLEVPVPTGGTDAEFLVVEVLDNDGIRINADATQTAGDGWLVFRPVKQLLSQLTEGGVT